MEEVPQSGDQEVRRLATLKRSWEFVRWLAESEIGFTVEVGRQPSSQAEPSTRTRPAQRRVRPAWVESVFSSHFSISFMHSFRSPTRLSNQACGHLVVLSQVMVVCIQSQGRIEGRPYTLPLPSAFELWRLPHSLDRRRIPRRSIR
jgi:hypothetical protein